MKPNELILSKSGKIICPQCLGTGKIYKLVTIKRKNKPNRKRRRERHCKCWGREIGSWSDLLVNAQLAKKIEDMEVPEPNIKRFYRPQDQLLIKRRMEE